MHDNLREYIWTSSVFMDKVKMSNNKSSNLSWILIWHEADREFTSGLNIQTHFWTYTYRIYAPHNIQNAFLKVKEFACFYYFGLIMHSVTYFISRKFVITSVPGSFMGWGWLYGWEWATSYWEHVWVILLWVINVYTRRLTKNVSVQYWSEFT